MSLAVTTEGILVELKPLLPDTLEGILPLIAELNENGRAGQITIDISNHTIDTNNLPRFASILDWDTAVIEFTRVRTMRGPIQTFTAAFTEKAYFELVWGLWRRYQNNPS